MLNSIFTLIGLRSHGNSIQISLGIILEFEWNFPGISLGIHGNPQELYIPTIQADSQWNSNILWDSSRIHWNLWGREKYWTSPLMELTVDMEANDLKNINGKAEYD